MDQVVKNHRNWYDKSYKILLAIPVLIFIISLIHLGIVYKQEGDFIHKDVSLTGGTSITLFDKNLNEQDLKSKLRESVPDVTTRIIDDFGSGEQIGIVVESKETPEVLKPLIQNIVGYQLTTENSSTEFSGSTISEGFYKQLRFALIISFVLMAAVVFVIFRTFVPSLAVIFAAFADIVMTITTVNMLGMEMSGAGIVAILMLIGYSVDTDILLTSRVLKNREGTINERIYGAFKTGMTMTIVAIASVSVSLFVLKGYSETMAQIFGIILIGLFWDIVNTWMTNASMLKWYAEVKKL